jgi:TetR/AcrR family transcriptional regulator, regulator of mycofactocin system
MSTPLSGPTRVRGRPVEINREHLAMVALRLFEARGFDNVSAAEIAATAGVSRRSLFRYYPTKADLVWDRFDESLAVLEDALTTAAGEPLAAATEALGVVADQTVVVSQTRTRLIIIAAHDDLFSYGSPRLQRQATILRTYLLDRGLEALQARVAASALTLASFSGYLHWATSSAQEHPSVVVREALSTLTLF